MKTFRQLKDIGIKLVKPKDTEEVVTLVSREAFYWFNPKFTTVRNVADNFRGPAHDLTTVFKGNEDDIFPFVIVRKADAECFIIQQKALLAIRQHAADLAHDANVLEAMIDTKIETFKGM